MSRARDTKSSKSSLNRSTGGCSSRWRHCAAVPGALGICGERGWHGLGHDPTLWRGQDTQPRFPLVFWRNNDPQRSEIPRSERMLEASRVDLEKWWQENIWSSHVTSWNSTTCNAFNFRWTWNHRRLGMDPIFHGSPFFPAAKGMADPQFCRNWTTCSMFPKEMRLWGTGIYKHHQTCTSDELFSEFPAPVSS